MIWVVEKYPTILSAKYRQYKINVITYMKYKTLFKKLLIINFLLLAILACKKNKEETPQPQDPCLTAEAQPLKAAFTMAEKVGDSLVITDTIMQYSAVRFMAVGKYDSVKWKIGTDARLFQSPSVVLEFDDPETIKVTLVGYRKPNKACFPTDDGVDTVSRNLVVLSHFNYNSRIRGVYRGYVVGKEQEIFDVAIDSLTPRMGTADYRDFPGAPPRYFVANLPKGIQNPPTFRYAISDGIIGGSSFLLKQREYVSDCQGRIMFGCLSPDSKQLTVDYTIFEGVTPDRMFQIRSKPYKFIGKRIK